MGDETFSLKTWLLRLYPGRVLQLLEMICNYHCVKSVQIRSFFWSVFCCIRTRKTPYLDTFYAVCRHLRARSVIENAFGILRARWRIFNHPIVAPVQNTEWYVMACLCLHNYFCQTKNSLDTPQFIYLF